MTHPDTPLASGLFPAGDRTNAPHRLSREGRDTLWLLAVMALIMAVHAPRLPWWANVGAVLAVGWRAQLAWHDGPMPRRWLLLVGLAASMGLTVITYHTLFGRDAGVTLVTLLACLKTLELRARRDAFVITSLGFFLILTQFLYSQSPLVALLMLMGFLGLMSSLVLAQRPLGRPSILGAVGVAGRSTLMGLPVMLALYLLFPRIGPLWSVPSDARKHMGLSDRIQLGQFESLATDDTVAMRLKFEGDAPPRAELYFRGPVLEVFDGHAWTARPTPPLTMNHADSEPLGLRALPAEALAATQLHYEATIEATHLAHVPLLEGTVSAIPAPPATEPHLFRTNLGWRVAGTLLERLQVRGTAMRRYVAGSTEEAPSARYALALPPGSNPRTRAWALAWRSEQHLNQADALTLTKAWLTYVREANYRYTLTGDTTTEGSMAQPIDRFWLERRAGFCEHFATSFVFIMRTWGIPSRVVTGFQGAELNPVDGLHVVRNSDAHAWAEVWQAGLGWIRVDPTAAVAPERIERPRSDPAARAGQAGALQQIDPALWSYLRNHVEAANHRWNVWVLQYSSARQMTLLKDLGIDSPSWIDLIRICAGLLTAAVLAGFGWLWWTRPKPVLSAWHPPMWRVHKALASLGLPAPAMPAPASALAWSAVIEQSPANTLDPSTKTRLQQALHELDAWRYGAQPLPTAQVTRQTRPVIQLLDALIRAERKRKARTPRY